MATAKKKKAPRTRKAPKEGSIQKADRIRHIRRMMADGQWVTGESGEVLAEQWNVHPTTLARDAAEASRGLREAIQGDEGIRAMALSALQTIIAESRRRGRNRDAIEAIKVMMGFPEVSVVKSSSDDDQGGEVTINVHLKPEPCAPSTSASPALSPGPSS